MSGKLAVIGGSGIYQLDQLELVNQFEIETPFGEMSSPVLELSYKGKEFYFLPRHGQGHKISPSSINFQANIFGLKTIGVDKILSVSAVGSLKKEHAPGDFVVVDQFIDWTKGFRKKSFLSEAVVGHVSMAEPVHSELSGLVEDALTKLQPEGVQRGTYICIEGPQFSTKAESHLFRSFNADVIGMTNVPEAYLAKEAQIAYATVAMVTDYDCWKEEHCSVEEIMKTMKGNYGKAQKFLGEFLENLWKTPLNIAIDNRQTIMTAPDHIDKRNQSILEVLLR